MPHQLVTVAPFRFPTSSPPQESPPHSSKGLAIRNEHDLPPKRTLTKSAVRVDVIEHEGFPGVRTRRASEGHSAMLQKPFAGAGL